MFTGYQPYILYNLFEDIDGPVALPRKAGTRAGFARGPGTAHRVRSRDREGPHQGHTVVQGRRAQRRFKTAVRRIIHWLLLRKRWSAVGRLLQQQPRLDLWVGLRRVNGRLTRQDPAPTRP